MGVNRFIAALASELFMWCILPDSKGLQVQRNTCLQITMIFSVSCNSSDNIHSDHSEALVLILFTFFSL